MSRFKFRAWNNRKKLMICPANLANAAKFALVDGLNSDHFFLLPNRDEFSLMQWTGLHDCTGVEIYEGDLVKWGENVESVSYNENTASFETETSCLDSDSVEVIGNIYENADLLLKDDNESWVNTPEDKLPNELERVLVSYGKLKEIAWYKFDEDEKRNMWFSTDTLGQPWTKPPLFWMRIPEEPEAV